MSEHPPIPEDAWDEMAEAICGGGEEPNAVHVRHLDMLNDVIGSVAPILWREWTHGMAVVPLPEPDNEDRDCWYLGERDIHAYERRGDPHVYWDVSLGDPSPSETRAFAAALLAAADRAEQLAADAKAVQP